MYAPPTIFPIIDPASKAFRRILVQLTNAGKTPALPRALRDSSLTFMMFFSPSPELQFKQLWRVCKTVARKHACVSQGPIWPSDPQSITKTGTDGFYENRLKPPTSRPRKGVQPATSRHELERGFASPFSRCEDH